MILMLMIVWASLAHAFPNGVKFELQDSHDSISSSTTSIRSDPDNKVNFEGQSGAYSSKHSFPNFTKYL
jgi:hypothetical protein